MKAWSTGKSAARAWLAWIGGATPALCLIAVALHLIPDAGERLEFRAAEVAAGEVWRVLTCHFVHWNTSHLLWDLVAFAILGMRCERLGWRTTWQVAGLAALAIPLAVALVQPDLRAYRGLSGLDSALFVLLALRLVADRGRAKMERALPSLALVGFGLKVAYEAHAGQTLFAEAGAAFVPVPLAHLVGALVALLGGACCCRAGRGCWQWAALYAGLTRPLPGRSGCGMPRVRRR